MLQLFQWQNQNLNPRLHNSKARRDRGLQLSLPSRPLKGCRTSQIPRIESGSSRFVGSWLEIFCALCNRNPGKCRDGKWHSWINSVGLFQPGSLRIMWLCSYFLHAIPVPRGDPMKGEKTPRLCRSDLPHPYPFSWSTRYLERIPWRWIST